jgi:hypothetical protein
VRKTCWAHQGAGWGGVTPVLSRPGVWYHQLGDVGGESARGWGAAGRRPGVRSTTSRTRAWHRKLGVGTKQKADGHERAKKKHVQNTYMSM